MTLFGFPAFGSHLDLMWSNIDLRWDIPLDPTELSHHPVEKEKVVRANLGIRKDVNFWGKIKKDQTHPNPRSTEVNTFEPIEHVHILLQVHLTNLTKSFWNCYLIPSIEFQFEMIIRLIPSCKEQQILPPQSLQSCRSPASAFPGGPVCNQEEEDDGYNYYDDDGDGNDDFDDDEWHLVRQSTRWTQLETGTLKKIHDPNKMCERHINCYHTCIAPYLLLE